ncbi:Outer membrane lipoprotein Blc [Pandoraea eparura]|jgi:apolipoprotein D and lipocalin family protein|uniref:Outer membrane lipoprotein Blc n=1 Tax=Pandoraea eparura TaxID=2508291 RepID=A0A5E4XMV3_9BURK|nr:lipocalin family protein [Pandoraea eparura]VVE37801.1 Outer membrane lipoprotein Blc [Pandoraea eparura]
MTNAVPAKRSVALRWLSALSLSFTFLLLSGCASTSPPPGVSPVSPFDVSRYQGRWYELARLDHAFERGMTDVSATYTPQPDGSLRVLNRGFDTANGQWREVTGKALFIGSPSVASLKVSFFGPFYGGYHVAALDPDYRWALVLGPDTGYCWILARDKHLGASERQRIVARAQALGVDTTALVWVTHDRVDPVE